VRLARKGNNMAKKKKKNDPQNIYTQSGIYNQAAPGSLKIGGKDYAKNTDPKNKDPRNTAAYKYYADKNVAFTDQQRWDPTTKKYVSIGKLMKQGKLDKKGNVPAKKSKKNKGK
jgi:hypothetical protein